MIQQYRNELGERVQRALGLQGDQLVGKLQPAYQLSLEVLNLEDHQYLWLSRTLSFAAGDVTPINAARFSAALLENLSTDRIVRVRRLTVTGIGTAMNCSATVQLPGTVPAMSDAVVRTPGPRDSRIFGAANSCCRVTFGTNIAGFNPSGVFFRVSTTPLASEPVDITLGPQSALWVAGGIVNIGFHAGFQWEERERGNSER